MSEAPNTKYVRALRQRRYANGLTALGTPPKAPRPLEADCQKTIVQAATLAGWLVHGERPSLQRSGKWSTAIQGHKGFPDLVLCHPRRRLLWFVELKRKPNKVEPAQWAWYDALRCLPDFVEAKVVWVPEGMDAFIAELVAVGTP